jgi:hypothetical protein
MATINVHQAKDGIKTYRVRVRRKGEPAQTASFATLKDARQWATMIEGQIIEGRHFPRKKPCHNSEVPAHSLACFHHCDQRIWVDRP